MPKKILSEMASFESRFYRSEEKNFSYWKGPKVREHLNNKSNWSFLQTCASPCSVGYPHSMTPKHQSLILPQTKKLRLPPAPKPKGDTEQQKGSRST